MINLLPPEAKRQLAAGRANRLLLRYLILSLLFALVTLAIFALVFLHLKGSQQSYQQTIDGNNKRAGSMADSQNKVREFRTNLATAKQILGKQINYSSIALKVADTIPRGVILEQLVLDAETINQPAKLNARATSEDTVLALKTALNDSNYFKDAHFDTVSRDQSNEKYPFRITITVTFTQELLGNG